MSIVNIKFPGNLAQVDDIDDLRAVPSSLTAPGVLYIVRKEGAIFEFDAGSTAADDGTAVIKPNDRTPLQAGRWVYSVDGFAPGPPGGEGPTGPANSSYATITALQAAPSSNKSFLLTSSTLPGFYAFMAGNYASAVDGATVISINDTPPTAGALVNVDTARKSFPTAQGGTDNRGVVLWNDAAHGRTFFGGTETSLTNDEGGYWNDWMAEVGHVPTEFDQGVYDRGGGRASYAVGTYGDAQGGHNNSVFGVAGFARGAGSSAGAAIAGRVTASFSGTTMTVSDVDWGSVGNGKVIQGSGINPNTTVTSQLTSTAGNDDGGNPIMGQEGTYQISSAHNLIARQVRVGLRADAIAAFIGYCASAIGKNCQAVGEKALAVGEGALAWGRASISLGYLTKAWRGIGGIALGYQSDVKGDGTIGIGRYIKAWYGGAIGSGVNPGSPLTNLIRGTLAVGMSSLRGTVRFIPGTNADQYTGKVGSYSGWRGLGDVGVATDIEVGSLQWPLVNGGSGGYFDLSLGGLRAGVLTPYMRIDSVARYPEFYGDRVLDGTARSIPTSTSTGVAGERCWDSNFEYRCISANAWRRIGIVGGVLVLQTSW